MKNNILKSIFVTILLLLGASHAANAAWTFNQGDVFYIDMSAITTADFGCNIFVDKGNLYNAEIVSGSATRNNETSDYFYKCNAPIIKVTFKGKTTIEDNIIVVKTNASGSWSDGVKPGQSSLGTNNCYKVNSDGNAGSLTTYGSPGGGGGGGETGTCNCTPSTMLYVYCSNGAPYIYIWEGSTKNHEWPGLVMSNVEGKEGWYQYDIDGYSQMILNNGNNSDNKKTEDLNISDYSTSKLWQWSPSDKTPSEYSGDDCPCSSSTYTVTIATNDANYGSVSPTEVANVASGTSISASGNSLTIGSTNVTATPTTQTAQYTYSFTNWTGIPNDGKVTDNITVTANFSRANRTYTITYNLNGGAWNGNAGATSYTYGTGLNPLPTNIQRAGYTFGGWYTAADFSGNAVTSISDTQTGNITLYANWTKNYASASYYYYDDKGGWSDNNCKQLNTDNAEYAYVKLDKSVLSNNKFKIFDGNNKSSWGSSENNHLVACSDNINGSLVGDISLVDANDGYKNIKYNTNSIATSTFYVILYYPKTSLNASEGFVIAASTTLPGGIAPAQDWYVYGVGGELSWDKNGGKKMSLHGEGYYYYTCSGVSQFKIDGSTLTDDALGGTYIRNDFPNAATANITLDDAGDTYHNINVTNATGEFEIRLYPAGKAGNTTSDPIIIAHRKVIAAGTFWYFDYKNTGWEGTIVDKWKLVDAGDYAYVSVPARNSDDNFFKIFPVNPKVDSQVTANGNNIADGDLAGEIKLTAEGGTWNNIKIAATTADYYVILYYPKTSTNSSDKYLVAATYDLPGVQKYAVSFGVVGKTGGTITAKSGSSTITSGQLVSRATFTATPAAGYSVEGWYADAEGNTRITAAGTKTTYSQAITEANNTVYVKFEKKYAIYFKPNDIAWDNIYAYLFTDSPWEDNGVHPTKNRSEYGQMSKLNDSVYYYNLTQTADITHFAFNNNVGQANYGEFNGCEAVYRSDFHKDMPVFIAQRDPKIEKEINSTKYYNEGVLMRFNDTYPGYELGIRNQQTAQMSYYRFTAEKAGDYISTVDVVLTKGVTYSFLVRNDKPYYFTPKSAITCNSSNSHFELFKWDNKIEVVIQPTVTGTYTFQLNLANGKVEIDVLYPTTSYRLVYVEKNGSTIEKFHPSHIIKSHPEATDEAPMFDTVSMHVRLKLLQKQAVSGTTDVKYDTLPNSNTCEVWLQEFKEDGSVMDWKTIQTINTQDLPKTNGVYNFIIAQGATKTSIDPKTIHPYTGRYYIRTDASDGGRNNYKQLSNYCYYTEYSRVYRGFDYYFCRWASKENITYTIACDYSYCVSDTLAQEDHAPHNTYTDANGKLQHEANVRFMWHSFSNELDRAYIAGAGDNLYLMSAAGIYDMEGNQNSSAKLKDQQNWVYRVDVKADTKAHIKLRAVPYNSATTYSWFRGRDGDFSEANTEQLIEGKSDTQYTIRVIYDFKTDHLICAWIPDKDTITANDVINADLMIIRTDQGEAAQLNFKPNETQLTNITVAYCVLNLTRDHLSSTKKSKEKSCYWVSFPFDVNLSDVFGCGKYGEDFIIQYYDGAERAQKGCWKDSPTYWKYITNPTGVVLKKGIGYVLVIDYQKILDEQFKHSNTSVNIYFPSSGPINAIDGVLPTAVEVPEHKCTITRNDRYIYDSNWNIIGIPTWANIDQFGNPMVATQSTSNLSQGGTETYTIGFYYAHDAKNNKWTVCDTKEVDFLSMYSYLVQWSGTINWQQKSASGEHHPTLAPRRYAPAAEGEEEAEGAEAPEQYTLRLTLNRGEQQLDHTYVRLQEGNVTTDFDLNYDMTKILNSGANIYSLVGTNLIQCAANVQPLQEEAQTISIPLGVVADQDGLYTFSLPDGTEGMNVSIADSESGTVHNLALGDYQTALTKGTYEGRFALEIQPRQGVSTGCEQTDAAGKSLRKVLIDGNLYILRDGKAYTAAGQEL